MGKEILAHQHCKHHRDEVLRSEVCGCFYCLATYPPTTISKWIHPDDVGEGTTARCPKCGIDSVIGSASGYPITEDFLGKMNRHWFL